MEIRYPSDREVPGLRKLWKQAFGDTDEYLDLFFNIGFAPERSLCALDGDAVAAAMYWLDAECCGKGIAYLYAVATDPAYRGRGLCRRLTEEAHRILKERGYSGAILVPAEPGLFAMYAKMGYETCSSVTEWQVPAGKPIRLSPLTRAEYARCRRDHLPVGAVIQEGETLNLLEAMGEFYSGDGVLLAVTDNGDAIWVPELLGDKSKAPGIVAALGAKTGKFRGSGEEKPFAMYHSFDGSPAPTYLGFALD